MNILIVASPNSDKDVTIALSSMLVKCGHSIEICSSISKATSSHNIIFNLGKKNLKTASVYARRSNIPLVSVLLLSTIELDYPEDYSLASEFLMIRDDKISIESMLPFFTRDIRLNYFIHPQKGNDSHGKQAPKVLVALDGSLPNCRTFLKILPSINISIQIEYTIINYPKSITNILNSHVKVTPMADDDLYYSSDFIIASGNYVHKAIKSLKPCIIVGDRGYGGILDEDNFEMQYLHYFQGRIGGELNEDVPLDFFLNDIIYLKENSNNLKNNCRIIYKKLQRIEKNNIQNLDLFLNQTLSNYQKVGLIENMRLRQTHLFRFIPFNDFYLMINQKTNQAYYTIEKEEMFIIDSFKEPCTYEEVYVGLGKDNFKKNKFRSLIKKLLHEKVLQIDI